MEFKDLENLFLTRQSCRNFNPEKTPDSETLKKITELAMLSPSACNSQPWRFIVTNKKDVAQGISSATRMLGRNTFTQNCTAFAVMVEDAPCFTERAGVKLTGRDFVGYDLGLACAHFVIAAEGMGVNTCILGLFNEKEIKKLLNIPEKQSVKLVIAMGYASDDDVIRKKIRKPYTDTCEFILE